MLKAFLPRLLHKGKKGSGISVVNPGEPAEILGHELASKSQSATPCDAGHPQTPKKELSAPTEEVSPGSGTRSNIFSITVNPEVMSAQTISSRSFMPSASAHLYSPELLLQLAASGAQSSTATSANLLQDEQRFFADILLGNEEEDEWVYGEDEPRTDLPAEVVHQLRKAVYLALDKPSYPAVSSSPTWNSSKPAAVLISTNTANANRLPLVYDGEDELRTDLSADVVHQLRKAVYLALDEPSYPAVTSSSPSNSSKPTGVLLSTNTANTNRLPLVYDNSFGGRINQRRGNPGGVFGRPRKATTSTHGDVQNPNTSNAERESWRSSLLANRTVSKEADSKSWRRMEPGAQRAWNDNAGYVVINA